MDLTEEQKKRINQLIDLISAVIAEMFAAWLRDIVDRNILKKLEK